MKFDDLDRKLRVFETAHDLCVLPGMYMVARLDGRGFTRLTKETRDLEVPFDTRFRDYMAQTTAHLMDCGFHVVYGYTQSDEISLLFHPGENSFNRKLRKYDSILAGEASARFSMLLGAHACFDSRISQLPNAGLVVDYFRWRNEDAHRNALSAHCYWLLHKQGIAPDKAAAQLSGKSVAFKNEFLFQHGINFNDLPLWQKRGTGLYWETYLKEGYNPHKGETVHTERRRIRIDFELPMKDEYSNMIRQMLKDAEKERNEE